MTLLSASWFGRFLAVGVQVVARSHPDAKSPLKIEVERLPDYRWRDLGFPLPRRRDEDC